MPQYTFSDRLKHAWNAFTSRDPTPKIQPTVYGGSKFIGSKDIRNDLAWDYIGRNSRLGGTAYKVRYKLKGR